MSADALPHTLLILLVEFSIGCLWVTFAAQWRGKSTSSFIKFGAVTVAVMAIIAFWVSVQIDINTFVDGYPLDPEYMDPARYALAAVFGLSLLYAAATVRGHSAAALVLGGASSIAGLVAIGLLAQVFSLPTWGWVLTFVSMTVGALVVGGVTMGMVLGHWYLVTPRLPEQPLREMTFLLLVAMGVQAGLLVLALVLPRDSLNNDSGVWDGPILENPFFWMRVAGGLAFPALLVWMAYDSSGVRAMQSATGLLYIAMALVLAGEVLARGLLFVSAVPN